MQVQNNKFYQNFQIQYTFKIKSKNNPSKKVFKLIPFKSMLLKKIKIPNNNKSIYLMEVFNLNLMIKNYPKNSSIFK